MKQFTRYLIIRALIGVLGYKYDGENVNYHWSFSMYSRAPFEPYIMLRMGTIVFVYGGDEVKIEF